MSYGKTATPYFAGPSVCWPYFTSFNRGFARVRGGEESSRAVNPQDGIQKRQRISHVAIGINGAGEGS
jgi:hypothetical protein